MVDHTAFVHTALGYQIVRDKMRLARGEKLAIDEHIRQRWVESRRALGLPERRDTLPPSHLKAVWYALLYQDQSVEQATRPWYVPVPPDPGPPPSIHRRLAPPLQVSGRSHFADANGQILPLGCTYGWGLGKFRAQPASALIDLEAIADAGYQSVRTWFSLGWYPYWRQHEVAPVSFRGRDGVDVQAWSDYWPMVRSFGAALAEQDLALHWSCGDLHMFGSDRASMRAWAQQCGSELAASGVTIAMADVNEPWQNGAPTPPDCDMIIDALRAGYGAPFVRLRGAHHLGDDNTTGLTDLWTRDCAVVHNHRGTRPGDFVTAIRHHFNTGYEHGPRSRLWVSAEPGGPAIDGGSPVMGGLEEPEGLCLMALASFIAAGAHVYHSHRGVQSWLGPIAAEPGFRAVPRVLGLLPADLHSRYRTLTHGNRPESLFHDGMGLPGEQRIDSAVAGNRDCVTLVYGGAGGRTTMHARVDLDVTVYVPHTGEVSAQQVVRAGTTIDLTYRIGRLVVARAA